MIKTLRLELMRLYYNEYSGKNNKQLDEMESLFEILKELDSLSTTVALKLIKSLDKSSKISKAKKTVEETALPADSLISDLCYENLTLETIESLDANSSITKAIAITLANNIGISKKSYKTRKDVFEDIFRMINNRDTMNATKNALAAENTSSST